MASFFDNLGDKLNSMGRGIADKAKEVSDTTKLNSQIREEEKKIQNAFVSIGQQYYAQSKENPAPEYEVLFQSITASEALIAQYKLEVQKIKGVCTCTNCGAEIDVNAAFCPSCGTKNEFLAKQQEAQEASERHCPNCGAAVKDDAVFCPECGNRVEEPAEEEHTEE